MLPRRGQKGCGRLGEEYRQGKPTCHRHPAFWSNLCEASLIRFPANHVVGTGVEPRATHPSGCAPWREALWVHAIVSALYPLTRVTALSCLIVPAGVCTT